MCIVRLVFLLWSQLLNVIAHELEDVCKKLLVGISLGFPYQCVGCALTSPFTFHS